MKAYWQGTLLVRDTQNSANHIPIQISSTLDGQSQYFHAQVTLTAGEQAHAVVIPFSQFSVLYIKGRKLLDNSPAKVIVGLDGYSGSVTTGEVKAAEFCIFNSDVIAVVLNNDNAEDVIVEVAAVGV